MIKISYAKTCSIYRVRAITFNGIMYYKYWASHQGVKYYKTYNFFENAFPMVEIPFEKYRNLFND